MIAAVAIAFLKYCSYLIILSVTVWFLYIHTSRFHILANRLPGRRFYVPFVGTLPLIPRDPTQILPVAHVEWSRKYNGIYRLFVGNWCYVVISSPELIEPLCKSQKYLEKGVSYDLVLPWLQRGLITNYGESWKTRRRLLTPCFHFEILNSFMDIFKEQSETFAKILLDRCESSPGKPIDVVPLTTRCTIDIICEAAMGVRMNTQVSKSELFYALERIQEIIYERITKPWLMFPLVFRLSSLSSELKCIIKSLNDYADEIIEERRRILQQQTMSNFSEGLRKKRLALLDLLLKVSEDEEALTNDEVRSEITTFLFAGHDTTASLVSWFLFCMASNPKHQKKLREELFEVFGRSNRCCNQNDLSRLKYMECCIKETLRLYPSVPAIERLASEDVRLGDNVIPAGSSMLISIYAVHRDPKHFADPEKFDPERFFPDMSFGRHPFSYIPFSAGPRNCIGQRFAMMEAKVILSTLLRNLEFSLSPECEAPKLFPQMLISSLNGINLMVKPLNKAL